MEKERKVNWNYVFVKLRQKKIVSTAMYAGGAAVFVTGIYNLGRLDAIYDIAKKLKEEGYENIFFAERRIH